ncbi:hypothetical protein ACFL6I_20145 [candidate division KSB1 bacterium]
MKKYTDSNQPAPIPEILPDEIFSLLNNSETQYSIGISDPGIEKSAALTQAINRALVIKGIITNYYDENISDYYINEKSNTDISYFSTRFVDYHCITSTSYIDYSKIDTFLIYYTKYDECVVILKTNPVVNNTFHKPDTLITNATIFLNEDNINSRSNNKIKLEIQTTKNGQPLISYNLIQHGHAFYISSENKEDIIPQKNMHLNYANMNNIANDDSNSCSFNLSYGIWPAFMSSLFKCITNFYGSNVRIKTFGDYFISKTENLIRQTAVIKAQSNISGIYIRNNALHIELESTRYINK